MTRRADPELETNRATARPVSFWPWTARQRTALAAALLPIAGWLLYLARTHPTRVPDPQGPAGPRAGELATRVDPNTADWPALAALPVIGERMAKAIVEYRESVAADRPGEPAFGAIDDLMRVKGIGKATTRALEPHLVFPPPAEEMLRPEGGK